MTNLRFYKVAGHVFSLNVESSGSDFSNFFELLDNYEPFVLEGVTRDKSYSEVFALSVFEGVPFEEFKEDIRQSEEGQDIICGKTPAGLPVFVFVNFGCVAAQLVCSADFSGGRLLLSEKLQAGDIKKLSTVKFAINNALMVMYALATANLDTALFHGAVVRNGGKGYMFLGKSGTGKSTHARLWMRYVAETDLLNDDNPVVRMYEDGARVYGSPWSGKTPCYRNEDVPLGGVVLLSQAPFNKIVRLRGVEAFAALVPSISGMRWDKKVADGLFRTENALVKRMPLWYLECLPDEGAARLCYDNVATAGENP